MQKEPSIPPLCGPCLMFYICLSRPGFYQHSSTSMLESSNQKVLSKNFVNMMWVIFHINSLFYINIQARRKRCQGIQRSYGFMHAYQPVRCRPDHWLGTGVDLLCIHQIDTRQKKMFHHNKMSNKLVVFIASTRVLLFVENKTLT